MFTTGRLRETIKRRKRQQQQVTAVGTTKVVRCVSEALSVESQIERLPSVCFVCSKVSIEKEKKKMSCHCLGGCCCCIGSCVSCLPMSVHRQRIVSLAIELRGKKEFEALLSMAIQSQGCRREASQVWILFFFFSFSLFFFHFIVRNIYIYVSQVFKKSEELAVERHARKNSNLVVVVTQLNTKAATTSAAATTMLGSC